MNTAKNLDQFYTHPSIAEKCFAILNDTLNNLPGYQKRIQYIEPSAGTGAFYNLFPKGKYEGKDKKKFNKGLGFDIDPKAKGVVYMDFIRDTIDSNSLVPYNQRVIVGNPPFGNRSELAIKFFNKASTIAPVIAFVVPVQFRKWSVQSKLNKDYSLIVDEDLSENSFIFNGSSYHVNCCFQIWTSKKHKMENLRILEKPLTTHPDFEMWQYNNTVEAEKVFYNDFDFAVLRQGYGDYTRFITDEKDCDRRKQWILFKAKTSEVLKKLKTLDFSLLSNKNTSVPGFGKADVINLYVEIYGD